MIDILTNITKVSIKSIFTVNKYNSEILQEDLYRILFIRNLIEESFEFVKEYNQEINADQYHNELKDYALELFLKQCEEAIPEEEKSEQGFNLENHNEESKEYFNFIY